MLSVSSRAVNISVLRSREILSLTAEPVCYINILEKVIWKKDTELCLCSEDGQKSVTPLDNYLPTNATY